MPFKSRERRLRFLKEWREKNKDKIIKDRKKRNATSEVKLYKYNYNRSPKMVAYRKKYNADNSERFRLARRKRRDDCYTAMGGKCVECGFNDYRALQVDHINGDGKKERHLQSRNDYYYNVLKSFLAGEKRYQLLCCNCNWIKREINGEYRKKTEETGQINH